MARRRTATYDEVDEAVAALDSSAQVVRAKDWPAGLVCLDGPGMYAWWVDRAGVTDLAAAFDHRLRGGRIYVGQTGATRWPSGSTGKATLRSRIGANHLRGRIRGSTFRLTLAALLRERLALRVTSNRRLDIESEQRLSSWIADHLSVAVHPFPDADALADLEHRVLAVLDPPLNLEGVHETALRRALTARRAALAQPGRAWTHPSRHQAHGRRILAKDLHAMNDTVAQINGHIQAELRRREMSEVTAVEAATWLDEAEILADSRSRPGLPLRNLVRKGWITGSQQRPPQPHGRWFIQKT